MTQEIVKLNDLTRNIKDDMIKIKQSYNDMVIFSFINREGSTFQGTFTRLNDFNMQGYIQGLGAVFYYVKPYTKEKDLYLINIGTINNYNILSPEEISKLRLDK